MKMFVMMIIALAFTSDAFAQQTADLADVPRHDVENVTLLLSGVHELAPASSFDAIPNAYRIVHSLASGPDGVVRDRALAALGRYWPSGDVFLLYAGVIASPATKEGTRHRVILMLAESFGERAIVALEPLLSSSDLQLRITTVQALGAIGTDEAIATINEQVSSDEPAALVEAADKATRVLR